MRIKRIIAATLAVLTIIFVNISPSIIYADESEKTYVLDVNAYIDGKYDYSIDKVGSFDLYINGELAAASASDIYMNVPYGTTYEIKNIVTYSGHVFNGISNNNNDIKGIVTEDKTIHFIFDCKPVEATFYRNYNESDNVTSTKSFQWCVEGQSFIDKKWDRNGYTLLGWSLDKNSKAVDYTLSFDDIYEYWLSYFYSGIDLYAVWQPNKYNVIIEPNGGVIEKDLYMTQNPDGSISLQTTYDSNDFYALGIQTSRTGYTFDGIYDADTDGNQVWDSNGVFVEGKYWDKNGNWIYDGNVTLYCHWKPIDYTMTFDYNKNGELTNADIDSKTVTYDSPYGELPDPGCAGWAFKEWNTKADGSGSTITKDDICKGDISVYALWSYKPVNVSVPQTLIGDKNGNSEFVVKSDDIESGSIDVTIPDGFYYNQEGKSPVYASISTDGDSKLTKDNTAIKYSIITDGLTAGCWSGSFNINLKLNK